MQDSSEKVKQEGDAEEHSGSGRDSLFTGDIGGETYRWHTEECHPDNIYTMLIFLDYHLPDDFEVVLFDGTYAEIKRNGFMYEVHASGDGDSFNHKVEFVAI